MHDILITISRLNKVYFAGLCSSTLVYKTFNLCVKSLFCQSIHMEKKQEVVVVNASPPDLPHDIIIAILKRLPVKNLLCFRCVCKDWNILIKTPSFITQQLHYNTLHNDFLLPPTSLFIGRHLCLINHDLQLIQYHNVPSSMDVRLVGSCNGLLCLRCSDYESFILWNPATRDILHVPPHETPHNPQHDHMMGIMGFGFSAIVNDYKIVMLFCKGSRDAEVLFVEVFSLSTGSWKTLAEAGRVLAANVGHHVRKGFPFDGAIFWLGYRFRSDLGVDHCLISFDIATESYTLIPIPKKNSDGLCNTSLTTHENKLVVLSGRMDRPNEGMPTSEFYEEMPTSESYSIDFWVLKSKTRSKVGWTWTKLYTIKPYPQCPHILRPLTVWRNQFFGSFEEVAGANYITNEIEFVLCSLHLHTNEFKMLARGQLTIDHEIQNFAESLVSLRNDHI